MYAKCTLRLLKAISLSIHMLEVFFLFQIMPKLKGSIATMETCTMGEVENL